MELFKKCIHTLNLREFEYKAQNTCFFFFVELLLSKLKKYNYLKKEEKKNLESHFHGSFL